jgi:hypothetical protein
MDFIFNYYNIFNIFVLLVALDWGSFPLFQRSLEAVCWNSRRPIRKNDLPGQRLGSCRRNTQSQWVPSCQTGCCRRLGAKCFPPAGRCGKRSLESQL